jgi:hypothetical protein
MFKHDAIGIDTDTSPPQRDLRRNAGRGTGHPDAQVQVMRGIATIKMPQTAMHGGAFPDDRIAVQTGPKMVNACLTGGALKGGAH